VSSSVEMTYSLCLFQSEEKPSHLHLAFKVANQPQAEAFHRAALARLAKATVRLVCVRRTTRPITQRMSLVRTSTISRRFAATPKPDPWRERVSARKLCHFQSARMSNASHMISLDTTPVGFFYGKRRVWIGGGRANLPATTASCR
jgi:hypothetical protein